MSGKGVRMSAKALARWKEEFKWVDKYPGMFLSLRILKYFTRNGILTSYFKK